MPYRFRLGAAPVRSRTPKGLTLTISDLTTAAERSPSEPPSPGRPRGPHSFGGGSATGGTAGEARRSLRRRSSLPSGRAVAGGFLVSVAALGVFAAYGRANAAPTTFYVVARHDIIVGTRLSPDDLTLLPMQLPDVVAGSAVFTGEERLVGATTVGPVRRGEIVQASSVVQKESGRDELEVSFALPTAQALGGTLRAGEQVDVLATFGAGGDAYTVTVVRQARVVDAGSGSGALGDAGTQTITLALAGSEPALALTHASSAGEVTLVRVTGSAVSGPVGQTYRAPATGRNG